MSCKAETSTKPAAGGRSGHRPCRRDQRVRRSGTTEDEVREVLEEEDEFQPKEGTHSLQSPLPDILEDCTRVRLHRRSCCLCQDMECILPP